MLDDGNEPWFSAASIWEIAIKAGLGRPDFREDPYLLRRGLVDNGYTELTITSEHTHAVHRPPSIHRDPFDRLLVAQAESEGMLLLTADATVARYPGPIMLV
ncbi:MAG TPA: type II toxin-antitoxin system VapC family toxin [Halomonas sp.]|nr:type II toxin-antitoxin system VapC family toxin [Halomonas sp.]